MKPMKCSVIFLLFFGLFLSGVGLAQDSDWPREIKQDGDSLLLYQPQLDSWKDRDVLEFRMAIMLTPAGESKPLAGALWLKADTDVDLETREVLINHIQIVKVRFSVVDDVLGKKAEAKAMAMLPKTSFNVSLDRVLAGLKATQGAEKPLALQNNPPEILVSFSPARLVIFDGEPVFNPIKGTQLQYVINTNWDLFSDLSSGRYYLLDSDLWLSATDLKGPWEKAVSLPADFLHIPRSDNWKDVLDNVPPRSVARTVPSIYVSTQPAELIVVDGKPIMDSIKGTSISCVSNTESDLFYCKTDSSFYYLVAGRWYRAHSLDGPWTYATPDLPPDFAKLPADQKNARVRASVPGTPEAQEAITVASIPQTAKVSKAEATLQVVYTGDPVFKTIDGTTLYYAANSQTAVIKISEGQYYACDRAVWFVASSPKGPWVVAASVPKVIYTIPPSCPVYNVTYVVIKEATPDYVIVSFTTGYVGCFVSGGVVFWGTGYYYPPYWYPAPIPFYYPYPYTWGCNAWYNPATNTYYRGGAVYGPYGGFGAGAVYNASTGTYARGFAAYGPYGGYKAGSAYNPGTGAWAHGAAAYGPNGAWRAGQGYNPQTGTFAAGAQGTNMYGSWGRGVVSRGDEWARGGYRTTAQGSAAGVRTSEGTWAMGVKTDDHQGGAVKTQNDTYVGKDGNIYKKTDSGWQKWDGGDWSHTMKPIGTQTPAATGKGPSDENGQRPAHQTQMEGRVFSPQTFDRSTFEGLDREAGARETGKQRTLDWQRSGMQFEGGGRLRGGRR